MCLRETALSRVRKFIIMIVSLGSGPCYSGEEGGSARSALTVLHAGPKLIENTFTFLGEKNA